MFYFVLKNWKRLFWIMNFEKNEQDRMKEFFEKEHERYPDN